MSHLPWQCEVTHRDIHHPRGVQGSPATATPPRVPVPPLPALPQAELPRDGSGAAEPWPQEQYFQESPTECPRDSWENWTLRTRRPQLWASSVRPRCSPGSVWLMGKPPPCPCCAHTPPVPVGPLPRVPSAGLGVLSRHRGPSAARKNLPTLLSLLDLCFGVSPGLSSPCVTCPSGWGGPQVSSSSLPELQCFISDSQLTRDAALHLGLGDMDVAGGGDTARLSPCPQRGGRTGLAPAVQGQGQGMGKWWGCL